MTKELPNLVIKNCSFLFHLCPFSDVILCVSNFVLNEMSFIHFIYPLSLTSSNLLDTLILPSDSPQKLLHNLVKLLHMPPYGPPCEIQS